MYQEDSFDYQKKNIKIIFIYYFTILEEISLHYDKLIKITSIYLEIVNQRQKYSILIENICLLCNINLDIDP